MAGTELTRENIRGLLPPRPENGHKGTFGHLFVLAGSRGFTGAAKLVCRAAERSGVGLVTVGVPYPLGDIIAAALTETMSLRLPATDAESFSREALEPALQFAADKQAVVLGPGVSRDPETVAFVLDFARESPVPLVIDADGLNALSKRPTALQDIGRPCILTPHPGEMARLTGLSTAGIQKDREGAAKRLAEASAAFPSLSPSLLPETRNPKPGCVVVLKGYRTVIAAPDGRTAVNPTGNSGLASGGTGDVLAGLLGGLLAQGMAPYEAACLGVYLHGLAGDLAAEQFTARGMTAGDVIAALPQAWRALEG